MTKAQLQKMYQDKLWRLQHLYSIKDAATGRVSRYVPRPEQLRIYRALMAGVRKIIILKARRLGMSTAIDVFAADEVIFNSGRQISIVDRNQDDAAKKLNGICKVAFASLPKTIRTNIKVDRDNDSAWEISIADDPRAPSAPPPWTGQPLSTPSGTSAAI